MHIVRRTAIIAGTLSKYFVFYKLTKHHNTILGKRIRLACEHLGPTFIKAGQILGMRYDLLSQENCEELRKLLDDVAPFPYEQAREIIKHDLGKYPEQLFSVFPKEPIAAASVSQVYKARTKEGKWVAVKVRRPYIGKPIEQDIRIIRGCMRIANVFSPTLRKIRMIDIVDEIHKTLLQEIDFRNETKNILGTHEQGGRTIGKQIAPGLGRVFIPNVYPKLCSYSVVTMDFLEGVTLNNYQKLAKDSQYDPAKSVRTLARSAMKDLFDDGPYFFHADPHPANIIIMKNGDVGLLDFGIIGYFEANFTKKVNDLFFAVYVRDLEATMNAALVLAEIDDPNAKELIREDIKLYLTKTKTGGIGFWFIEIARIFVKHRFPVPRRIVLFGRMNVISDGLLHMVEPNKTTIELIGEDLQKGVEKRMLRNLEEIDYASVLYLLSEKAKGSPETVKRLLNKYADDPLSFIRDVQGTR